MPLIGYGETYTVCQKMSHVKVINVRNAFITLINYLINKSVSFINDPISRLGYCKSSRRVYSSYTYKVIHIKNRIRCWTATVTYVLVEVCC